MENIDILKDYYNLPIPEREKINTAKFPVLNDFMLLPNEEKTKVFNALGITGIDTGREISLIDKEEEDRKSNIIAQQQEALKRTSQQDLISPSTNRIIFENQFIDKAKPDIDINKQDILLKKPEDIVGNWLGNISKERIQRIRNLPENITTQLRAARPEEISPRVELGKEPFLAGKLPTHTLNTMKSFTSGVAQSASSIYKIPALAYSIVTLPGNLVSDLTGLQSGVKTPEFLYNNALTQSLDRYSETMNYKKEKWGNEGFDTIIQRKNIPEITEYLLHSVIENAPTQMALLASAGAGYSSQGLALMGAQAGAEKFSEGTKKEISTAMNTLNATLNGTIEAAFESIGTLGAFKKWEIALSETFGKETTSKIIKQVGKAIAYSFMAEANEEALTTAGQAFSDYITGFDKNAFKGIGYKMLESGLIGGISGATMTAPFAVGTGYNKAKVNNTIKNLENVLKSIEPTEGGTDIATGSKEGKLDITGMEELSTEQQAPIKSSIEHAETPRIEEKTEELSKPITESEQILIEEAKKYKSAEEFVKAHLEVDTLLPSNRPMGEKTLADLKYTGNKANTQKVKVSPIEDVINKAKSVADSGGDGSVGNYEVYDVLKKVKNGRIKVYHGTSESGANAIGGGWAGLKDGSYLSLTKGAEKESLGVYGAKYYADIADKYGKGGQVLEFEIPLKNVAIDKTTGELRYVADKTKSKLKDIWDKAHTEKQAEVKEPIPEEEKALIEEAKKYKTAEEFIKARGETRFHQTFPDNAIKIEKQGFKFDTRKSAVNDYLPVGVSTKSTPKEIGIFGKGKQMEVFVDKNAKTIKFNDRESFVKYLSDKSPEFDKAHAKIGEIDKKYNKIHEDLLNSGDLTNLREKSAKILSEWKEKVNLANQDAQKISTDYFKKNGYDVVRLEIDKGGFGKEIVDNTIVLNPSQIKIKSQLEEIWKKAHTTTPEAQKTPKEAVLPEKDRIIPETTEPAKEHYQMTKEISMNQQIQDIIRTSKNTLEAKKAIKAKFDLDLSLPEIKTMETAIKSGVPFDIAPQLMRDLLNKIKAKDTKIVDDLGLDKEFNISIERIMDSMTLLGKTKEFINENYKKIVQAINQLEFAANYCYAYSDTKPYQESIVDSFVKEIKMLTIVDNSIKSIKMAEHPEILRKIWLKSDRTNVNVDKLIKENPELVETDLIANEGLKELRNLIQKQIITEYMDGLFGIRIKTEGIRHQVEYTLKTGEKRIKWVNNERYYKMTSKYPGDKLKLLDTKETIILKMRDPKTGEYSQKRMMVEKYDEVLKSALLTEHQQELANNLIPYKNWISHLRKGDYWVIVNEKTSAGQFVEVFASRVKNRFIAQKIKEEIENKSKAFIVDVHKHKETFMAEKLFLGSVVNIPAKLKNIGIDPLSDAGQRIINSQRSMSTIFSHLIESKNLPGFETSYNSIIEGISQIARSAIHRQNRIEMQDLLGEAIKNKKTFTDPFRYKVLVQYLTAIAEAREASPVLDSIKSITYFSILGNSFRAAIQNLSEPIWYWARLPKLNNPIRFTLPLQPEYRQLIEQAKNEGIIKPYLEPDINASKIQKIEFLFNESEKFGTKIDFNLALRLARDKGLHGQEAYRFAYQQVFNVAKPFYNRGNVPIGLLKSKFRGTTEFGLMFLRWVLDWFGKTVRGVGAGFIRTLLKTGLAWVIIAGLGTVPIIGRRLVRILGLGGFEKKPQDLNIQERFILGGLMGTAKVDPAFLVPLMYKGAGTVNLGITRGFDILRERMSRTERDVKKYGTTGYFGSIPMIGQYISGAQKAKYGIKSGKKIIYTPATVYEKMLLRVGLTPLALGETYKIREEIKELSKKINKLRQEEKTKNFKEKMKLKKEIIILEKQKKQLAKNISSY